MARGLLSPWVAPAVLAALGCQVAPIAIVDCRTTDDCEAGTICSPEHACVPPDAGMTEPPLRHPGDLLVWDATGNVPDGQNPYEMTGSWFLYDDCGSVLPELMNGSFVCPSDAPTKSCCTERDASLVGPPPLNEPGWTVTAGVKGESSGTACARLTTPEHMIAGQFGAGLALNLNNGGAFDASRPRLGNRIVGFSFDIESQSLESPDLAVGIGTTDNDSHFMLVPIPTRGALLVFDQLPFSHSEPPSPLDLTAITRINFAMLSTESAAAYDFCVTDVHLLLESTDPSSTDGTG
jgi:hypothetical protein